MLSRSGAAISNVRAVTKNSVVPGLCFEVHFVSLNEGGTQVVSGYHVPLISGAGYSLNGGTSVIVSQLAPITRSIDKAPPLRRNSPAKARPVRVSNDELPRTIPATLPLLHFGCGALG